MYELARGPLVWLAFVGLVAGTVVQLGRFYLLARKEKSVLPTFDAHFGLRSILHWIVPFSSRNTRMHPTFTIASYLFHLCILLTPLLVMGHAVLWEESWGVHWWSLPPAAADAASALAVILGVTFMVRRLVVPEARRVARVRDFLLILLVISPFATGLAAHLQWLPQREALVLHILCGAAWLLAIPVTWLKHMFLFGPSRAYMGSEFGAVRNARDW